MMSQRLSGFETKIVEKLLSSLNPLQQHLLPSRKAAEAILARTALVDEQVAHAYRSFLSAAFPEGLSLLAVGGYGRRELFPHSDIDLILLVDKPLQSEDRREALSGFLRSLWDGGLRLSQSVRSVAECTQFDLNNVELSVSLLDQRFLVGDHQLNDQLSARLPKFFSSQRGTLMRHLSQLTSNRHAKFHNTIYHLEPNIKESPGGMRDLNLIHWLSQLRGVIDESSFELEDSRQFLFNLRYNLHEKAGRDSNILTFDMQEELADDPALWMREYYRHSREIYRAAVRQIEASEVQTESGLSKQFRQWRSRLSNAEFTVARDRIFLRSHQQLVSDPSLLFRLLEFVAHHGLRLSMETERRVRQNLTYFEEYFAAHKAIWPPLRQILSQPRAAMAVRAMHETGLLTIFVSNWQQIECLVVRDFYHRYTVDEHTMVTLEYLDELRDTKDPARMRFANLLAETENLPLLYTALLFHDTGKSGGLEGHAVASARQAHQVLEEMQMPEQDRRNVLFLIEHHLDLSAVMNSRDLGDPATATDLAVRVQTLEYLRQLTLLTYADISAVNPEAMTPWRLEQLWRTHIVAHRELTRELENERIRSVAPVGSDERSAFLEGFPTRYLRTRTEAQIQEHLSLYRVRNASGVALDLRREEGSYILTVIAEDRPFLFASIAGAISCFGLNILKAEAFSNAEGIALDTFSFADPLRTIELNPMEADRLKLLVQRVALGKEDVRRLLRGRAQPILRTSRPSPEPTVAFDSSASDFATLVEIVAVDRPGLLYDVASTVSASGCSIDVVLIDTEAHKAFDVFYITRAGKKLEANDQSELRTQLLEVCRS